jgi:hypothetical protein
MGAGQAADLITNEAGPGRRRLPPLHVAVLTVIAAWAVAFEVPRFIALVVADPAANDFRLSYIAAQAGLRWGWAHMYDPDKLTELSRAFGPADAAITPLYNYDYPPLLAWLIAPLTTLPLAAAVYVWAAINIAAFVVAWRLASPGKGLTRAAILLGSLAIWPVVFSLERGQPVLITFALAIGCWWMAQRRHDVLAGVLLGLAFAIKPPDVLLLPAVLFMCGFRRAAAWWLATTVTLWAVFALVLGPTGIGTYLAVLAWTLSDPGFTATPIVAPFGPQASLVVGQALFAAAALAGAWRQRRNWRLAFAIGIVGTLVSGVHFHEYDFAGLVVAAWLAFGEPAGVVEIAWLAIGIVCAQLPAIGIRLPILVWQPVWLAMLVLRSRDRGINTPRWNTLRSYLRSPPLRA